MKYVDSSEKKTLNRKKMQKILMITVMGYSLALIGIFASYAFFVTTGTSQNQKVSIQAGTMELVFSDGTNSFQGSLKFGSSATKTFKIENAGSLDSVAKINWQNLINTYKEGSLTYTISFSETEEGTYTDILTQDVPISESEITAELANGLTIPAGKTYYYKLVITLNYIDDVDQTSDLQAMLSTTFTLEESDAKVTITFDANDGMTQRSNKIYTLNTEYSNLPTLTRENYKFLGWFTDDTEGEKVTTKTVVSKSQILYAHWKATEDYIYTGNATEVLLSKINDRSVTNYNQGDTEEMYTFTHNDLTTTTTNSAGTKTYTHSATQVMDWREEERTDYRYIGKTPNNYINFNDETWRIVGIFTVEGEDGQKQKRVKIIRDEDIGRQRWDTNNGNEWPSSSLSTLLNLGDYYNRTGSYSTTGLSEKAQSQISPAKWYLGGTMTYTAIGGPDFYNFERGETVYTGFDTNIVQNVGFIYPSDYIYAYSLGISDCYKDGFKCNQYSPKSGWLYFPKPQWVITPSTKSKNYIYTTSSGNIAHAIPVGGCFVRPSVYLNHDIEIIGGTGTIEDMYILKS